MTSGDLKNKAAFTREGRKQLFAVLQSARGSTGDFMTFSVSKFLICYKTFTNLSAYLYSYIMFDA